MAEISKQELNCKFIEQIKMMEKSKIDFIKGDLYEAYRVATSLRILLHDTRKSTSLLSQLGIKDSVEFYDVSRTIDENNPINEQYSLLRYSLSKNPPILFKDINDAIPKICFEDWWHKKVIADGNVQGNTYFSRKDVVLYLAEKEGGAHVDRDYDKKEDEAYYNLTRSYQLGKSGSFFNNLKTGELISLNELGFLYSVIAISFELICTLFDVIPDLQNLNIIKGVTYDPKPTNIIESFSIILAD